VKAARPVIETTTTVRLRCSASGQQRITIQHATVVVGSGVRTELSYELPPPAAGRASAPWRVEIEPAQLPLLRSWQGATLSEQRLAGLSLRMDSGSLHPGARVSGATQYRLPEFAPGVSVVLEFAGVPVDGVDC